uniref:Protein kinase domain-containing protein n=1 Tax=Octactis speculum TaxID=3111310 RepID=A0A7S2FVM9_9STRA|mmetsp:Transcript_30805/g.41701  ORF Transcript_30805/g.41701 Transcript_30805/m.41701 type:complete len:417 (+) Transcript_30805:94-1344(+)|eukprot:CAMPEP_0185771050 /NCGR_PEP_ID=MMETSP1174-20130828/62902_1 /TAXON_ID=35687 /ORGANISM="Dictyocha speculum, Strain CCMP1381" /LENGTH=416 /DNA_ID=CAMNT_0028456771 /DNA_START=92 /DNA_END=1342 /DNA_ORIENTATION=-
MGATLSRLTPCMLDEESVPSGMFSPNTRRNQRQQTDTQNIKTIPLNNKPLSYTQKLTSPIEKRAETTIQHAEVETKYILRDVVGMGSTSVVRRCVHRTSPTGRQYACKIISKQRLARSNNGDLEQFMNEIEVLMELQKDYQHPHIIRLEDVFITARTINMVMEVMNGGELFDYVVSRGTLSEAEASVMLRKVISAVAYMHSKGIVHRDLKPENLLMTFAGPSGEVKVIDFGLSKLLSGPDSGTSPGTPKTSSFLGTKGYLAPEMIRRESYSKAIDMWAVGVIAFILVCGCLPFDDATAAVSDEVIREKYALQFPSWAMGLSSSAKDLLKTLLEVDPKARATAAQALEHPWIAKKNTRGKSKLLASPKYIKSVPKTPKSGIQAPDVSGKRGGIGAAVGHSHSPGERKTSSKPQEAPW